MSEIIAIAEFKTYLGDTVKCVFKKRGANIVTPASLIIQESGLFINMVQNGSGTESPIKTSEAIFNLVNKEAFAAMQLMAIQPRSYIVEISINDDPVWSGFMQPDQYNEPFAYEPTQTSLTFIDGLALLKRTPFVDDSGNYWRGRWKDSYIIARCILATGMKRNFVDEINIYDINTPSSMLLKGTLFQKYKDVEAFKGMSCYEVLENILKSYTARVEFFDNKYWFRRIDNHDSEVFSVQYQINSYNLPEIVYTEWRTNKRKIDAGSKKGNRLCFQDTSQIVETIPAWKSFVFVQNYGKKPSILPRWNFEKADWVNDNQLKNWQANGIKKTIVDNIPVVEFKEWFRPYSGIPSPYTPPAYIEQQTIDEYSLENVDVDIETSIDLFDLVLKLKNNNFEYPEAWKYGGPRTSMAGKIPTKIPKYTSNKQSGLSKFLFGSAAGAFTSTGIASIDQTLPIQIKTDVTLTMTFKANVYGEFRTLIASNENVVPPVGLPVGSLFFFTDAGNCPKNFQPGRVYTIVETTTQSVSTGTFWYVKLKEYYPNGGYISIDEVDVDKEFEACVVFVATKCQLKLINPAFVNYIDYSNLNIMGNFNTHNEHLKIEIGKGALDSKGNWFEIGVQSIEKPQSSGTLLFRMNKPETIGRDAKRDGGIYLSEVRLTIIDTPEYLEEEVIVDTDNYYIDNEVNVMFAETPIKNNFKNNNLKFYNNFYSLSTQNAPGLQYYNAAVETEPVINIKYGNLYNQYAALNIARTDLGWRLPSQADWLALAQEIRPLGASIESCWERIGIIMRSRRTYPDEFPRWQIPNPAPAIAEFGQFNSGALFNAMPSGYRSESDYVFKELSTRYWSSSVNRTIIQISLQDRVLNFITAPAYFGLSVRLVRNATPEEMLTAPLTYLTPYVGNDENKSYKTIRIGSLVWMAENLCDSKLYGGASIPIITNLDAWKEVIAPAMCYPDNNIEQAYEIIMQPITNTYKATLKELIINFYKSLYKAPRKKLSATLNSNALTTTPIGVILEETHTEKDYIMNNVSWNVFRNIYSGSWDEVGNASTEPFIPKGSYSDDYDLTERK